MAILGDTKATSLVVSGTSTLASINANSTGLGTNGQLLKSTGTGIAWVDAASSHTHSYLPLAGGTMTGILKAYAEQYTDNYTTCGIDMQNSDIVGLNSIYTKDASDNAGEGIHFYRDSTHVDSLWINGGDILFAPNRALGTGTTKANSEKIVRMPASITTDKILVSDGTTGLTKLQSIGNHTYTKPTGATSRTADVAVNTTTVNSITAVGTLPSLTVTATDVVTSGTTTDIPNISKKTVVTSATAATASYTDGILTISNGSVTTGDSVTVGTAIAAYTALTTSSIGSASGWSAGTLPTKGSNTTVATGIKTQPTFTVTTTTDTLSHSVS